MEEAEIMLSLSLRTGDQQTNKIFANNASETRRHDSISPARMTACEIDINAAPPKERRDWRNNRGEEEEEEEEEEAEVEEGEDESSGVNGGDQCKRKKLRLTFQQSAVLEDCFKQHNTLSPKKKLELAKSLSLKPRQVEVWFQNRRARTKLKQTEVDYEYFRRCCEALTQENQRLQRELMQLRSLEQPPHLYMQVPATTLVLCSSCEREKVPDIPTAIPL